ncbi:hypothetical protein M9Y10_021414 [Tritrichomonas musculus]|uniref:Uncharacterized protein n=1 Tax=Tritrichomonas musculus TaxID=1915356 RepID=A0ABR2HDV3_9EUKA
MNTVHVVNNESMLYDSIVYDIPNENQQQPREHRIIKSPKLKKIPETKFQPINKVTNPKKLLNSFRKVGKCLNKVNQNDLLNKQHDKVCLILINQNERDKPSSQVGELNDAYLFSLYHNRLGFKVFYLYNSAKESYMNFLQLFILSTNENLTIFYSGNNVIDFRNITFENKNIESNNSNIKNCKITFISDCKLDNSIFDIQFNGNAISYQIMSFTINKIMHGLFIYYYCKTIFTDPSITLQRLLDKLKVSLTRFKETFAFKASDHLNQNEPIYINCYRKTREIFGELVDDSFEEEEESFEEL